MRTGGSYTTKSSELQDTPGHSGRQYETSVFFVKKPCDLIGWYPSIIGFFIAPFKDFDRRGACLFRVEGGLRTD
jgi:hypothetical protein